MFIRIVILWYFLTTQGTKNEIKLLNYFAKEKMVKSNIEILLTESIKLINKLNEQNSNVCANSN